MLDNTLRYVNIGLRAIAAIVAQMAQEKRLQDMLAHDAVAETYSRYNVDSLEAPCNGYPSGRNPGCQVSVLRFPICWR